MLQTRAVNREGPPRGDSLGGRRGGVQVGEPRDRGPVVGLKKEQTKHELRKAESSSQILLRWRHDQVIKLDHFVKYTIYFLLQILNK